MRWRLTVTGLWIFGQIYFVEQLDIRDGFRYICTTRIVPIDTWRKGSAQTKIIILGGPSYLSISTILVTLAHWKILTHAFLPEMSNFRKKMMQNPQNNVPVCSVQPTLPCLVDKGLDLIDNNPEVVLYMTIMIMAVWFSKTVAQGSISFSFKALGLHFEVKKGS